ncbi:hypothetical protein, partial [uncultured Prevotella sp.]|uniref:hypothetical protein n=1 Tax=uncultured Prevotella sp. TaxID=159272 RepID=UPI0026745325
FGLASARPTPLGLSGAPEILIISYCFSNKTFIGIIHQLNSANVHFFGCLHKKYVFLFNFGSIFI